MAKSARATIYPKPGVFRGATPDVSAGRWYDANLMRWRAGQAQPIGGWAALGGYQMHHPGRDVMTWHDNKGDRWAIVGCDNALHAYNFQTRTQYDITPSGVGPLEPPGPAIGYGLGTFGHDAYGTARDPSDIGVIDISPVLGDIWSMDLFGQDVMIVPTQDGHLFRWSPTTPTTLPAIVPGAPTQNQGVVVTDERHVVLLGAGGNRRAVAWSDQEDPNSWAVTVSNLAGDLQLETEGRPMAAIRVASGVLILTDNDIHLMKYAGPPYAYGINKVGANCGPISRRAVGQAGGVTMWMAQQCFWQFDGSLSPMTSDVGDWLFSLVNRDMVGRVFAMANPAFGELWWFWPDEGSGECNRYVVRNYIDPLQWWTIGQMARTAADIKSAMARPICATQDGRLMVHEYGWTDDGAPRDGQIYLETGSFTLSEDGGQRMTVRQIIQDFVGPAERMGYRFLFWEEPDGPVYDSGTYRVINDTGRTDMDDGFSCRGFRMRLEGLTDGPFAIGKTRLDLVPSGYV